jgi:CheY-like chemotaxis protein
LNNRFILVADTSDAILGILREELATTNYALLHAKDGLEAIRYLELLKSEIDLAIIHLELPVVNGPNVIGRLAKRKQSTPVKIIATTSASDDPVLEQIVSRVDAVVQTPIPAQEWRKLLAAVLVGGLSGHVRDTDSSTAASG